MDRQTEGEKQQGGDIISMFRVMGLKILGRIGTHFGGGGDKKKTSKNLGRIGLTLTQDFFIWPY